MYLTAFAALAIAVGAGADAFGQGKGRGGGNGKGHGGGQKFERQHGGGREHRGGPPQREQWGGGGREFRKERGNDRRQMAEQMRQRNDERRQQRANETNARRQRMQEFWQRDRGQQQRAEREARRQQEWSDRQARLQQMISDREARRRQRESDREARRRHDKGERESRWRDIWKDSGERKAERRWERDDDDDDRRRSRHGDRRGTFVDRWFDRGFEGYKNYGQYRSAQVHRRNAERKAAREGRYWDDRYRYDDGDGYSYVVRNIIYNRIFNDRSYAPRYETFRAYVPHGDAYYGAPFNYAHYGVPAYQTYVPEVSYYVPQYGRVNYEPYYSGYAPAYGYDDEYGYHDDPYGYDNGGGLGDLIGQLTGNSFIGELLSGFLLQGYDQGYLMGQLARESGYGDDLYYDPYAVNASGYDAYSINVAENRRIFSEGYEAGYRDALEARRDDYEPYYDSQPDLISLLIGNVLGGNIFGA